jgi:hypothetical protein
MTDTQSLFSPCFASAFSAHAGGRDVSRAEVLIIPKGAAEREMKHMVCQKILLTA